MANSPEPARRRMPGAKKLQSLLMHLVCCNHPHFFAGTDVPRMASRRGAGGCFRKLAVLDRILKRLKDGHRVVLFSQFTSMLDILRIIALPGTHHA